ncbi:MAG: phosphoglucosamine mutase [Oscillospiraceae bacterium]|nr:phosphoglucosamine mutase [Oscillospiraceae bacterium]
MGKLFGTDGIRGIANVQLDATLAYRIGQAAAIVLGKGKEKKPVVVIGKDTRISSDMLEGAITAGFCACGCNVHTLGVISTPAVALATVMSKSDAGVVISASHNPYEYNGIKFFGPDGSKLPDEMELAIEELILQEEPLPTKTHGEIGVTYNDRHTVDAYVRYLASTVKGEPHDLRVLVDCANGAASVTAQRLLSRYDMDVSYINDKPNGVNINSGCGSTHLEMLGQKVREGCYDVGIAFDGDADRCLAVDENGNEIDGDKIMALCARAMKEAGDLQNDGFVATVMSNMGLHKYAKEQGFRVLCADVGDRNVRELMVKENMVLGGEQSGHIIFMNHMPTGDGQLTALHFLSIVSKYGATVSSLVDEIKRYPQVLINVPGPHDATAKRKLIASDAVQNAIREKETGLDGRILVRPSGTEALLRVMVEASEEAVAQTVAEELAKVIEEIQK